MIRIGLTTLILGIAPLTLSADPIGVRSGDHSTFTRLAFDLPEPLSWSIETEEDAVVISFGDHAEGFDLTSVFERIDRRRVARVIDEGDSLRVELSCDCYADAFEAAPRMIALDIRESGAERPTGAEEKVKLPNTDSTVPTPAAVEGPEIRLPVVTQRSARSSPVTASSAAPEILADLRRELTREIADAATKGVLKSNGQPASVPREPVAPSETADAGALPEALAPEAPVIGNIQVSSSLDLPDTTLPTASARRPDCLAQDTVAIADWSDGRPMPAQVARLRSELFDERDNVDRPAAEKLAQVYLHFGFGPEAMRVLQLHPELRDSNGVLIEMGEIMEYGHVRNPRILHLALECDGPVAFWALLAKDQVEPTAAVDVSAILLTLNALPLHLRETLAPQISGRLLSYGDAGAAEAALRIVERVPELVGADAELAQAKLDLDRGDTAAAQAGFKNVMNSNSAQSAQALIAYIESRLEEGQPVSEDAALLVEAYLKELRGGPLEPGLRRARVLSLAQSEQFDAAFKIMNSSDSASDASTELRLTVLRRLAERATDIVFLSHVFEEMDRGVSAQDGETRLALAGRLFELGFPDEAEMLLAANDPRLNAPDVRRLKARIALAQSKPFLAQAHLIGLQDEASLRLLAEAKMAAGALEEASDDFARLNDQPAADRAALLSEDWIDRLAANPGSEFEPLARIAESDVRPSTDIEGMLTRSRNALSESAEARRILQELVLQSAGSAGGS